MLHVSFSRWLLVSVAAGMAALSGAESSPLAYRIARDVAAPAGELRAGSRLPFGWSAFAVTHEAATRLTWADVPIAAGTTAGRLRVTVALDDRALRHIEIALAKSGRALGSLDLRYAQGLQMFELVLPPELAAAVQREGVTLRLRAAGAPIWLFAPAPEAGGGEPATRSGVMRSPTKLAAALCPPELQPHLLFVPAVFDARAEYRRRFASTASLAPFGWTEGCVLEGLRALAAGDPASRFELARRAHWALFTDAQGELNYENPRAGVMVGAFDNIEALLPLADIALQDATHPIVAAGVAFFAKTRRVDGVLQGGPTLSAEGSYTMGYPLAVLGAVRHERAQAEDAVRQLLGRRDRLWHEGALWLRHDDQGRRTFRNWARGVTWHFLGLVRALPYLRQAGVEVGEIEAEIRRVAALARLHQRPDGLWNCFIDDRAGIPDASGSAGIATALALGARAGVLGADDLTAARKAIPALEAKLTPDGFLGGVAQGNRGGEELQRSDYRVLSTMGMGLLAQALAATR